MTSRIPSGTPRLPADVFTPAVTRAQIDILNSQIRTLYNHMRALAFRRQTLKAHLDAYVYPVLTLPNEIISEIFLNCLSEDRLDRAPSPLTAPLILGQICRKWRAISLSTPSLWTTIQLSIREEARENQLRLLETWLTRSRDCPLSISLSYEPEPLPTGYALDHSRAVPEFIKAVLPHCRRWHEVEFILPFPDFSLFQGEMPLLSDLTLAITNTNDAIEPPPNPSLPVALFHQAPALRDVVIASIFDTSVFVLPWAQLRSVSLTDPRLPHELAAILRSVVNVEYFMAKVASPPDDPPQDILPIPPLLHLNTLSLSSDPGEDAHMQILDALTLPALLILKITEADFMSGPVTTVRSLLCRSECPLEVLHIIMVNAVYRKSFYRVSWPFVADILLQRPNGHSADESDSEPEDQDPEDDGGNSGSSDG